MGEACFKRRWVAAASASFCFAAAGEKKRREGGGVGDAEGGCMIAMFEHHHGALD